MFILTILLLIIIILICAYCERFRRSGKLINNIPGPKSFPIIGNAFNYMLPPGKFFDYQLSLFKDYGEVNQIHALNFRIVHISNPDDIEKILSTKYSTKSEFYRFLVPWLGYGLLNSNGVKWHQRRKLLTRAFHFNILKKYAVVFNEETERFLKKIQEETDNEKSDVMELISDSTLRILCETSMGLTKHNTIDNIMNKYLKSIVSVSDCFTQRMCNGWLHNDVLFSFSEVGRIQKKALKYLHGFTNKVINDRRIFLNERNKENEMEDEKFQTNEDNWPKGEKLAMLDLLLQSEKDGVIEQNGIREEVDTFMFAGHDTTAASLSFLLMAVANAPVVQDKIYEEIHSIFGNDDRPATMQDISEMKYLDCCIKESMRMFPTAFFFSRHLSEDTILGGYTVPKDTTCLIHIFALHNRADVYPEPDRYIPERFLPENCINRHHYAYIPFSAGPRNCIGQKYAMLEIKTMMSGIMRKFRVEPVTKPSDLKFKASVILRTVDPIYVRFRPRN